MAEKDEEDRLADLVIAIQNDLIAACKKPMTPNNLRKVLIEKYADQMSYMGIDDIVITAGKKPGSIDVLYPIPVFEFTFDISPPAFKKDN